MHLVWKKSNKYLSIHLSLVFYSCDYDYQLTLVNLATSQSTCVEHENIIFSLIIHNTVLPSHESL